MTALEAATAASTSTTQTTMASAWLSTPSTTSTPPTTSRPLEHPGLTSGLWVPQKHSLVLLGPQTSKGMRDFPAHLSPVLIRKFLNKGFTIISILNYSRINHR